MEATLVQGSPLMVDYTPGADIAAGQVVEVGDLPFVAHLDIATGRLGALAAGGGVYEVTADAAIAAGKKVYWDDATNKVTLTATSNPVFGYVAPDSSSAADGDKIKVIHKPLIA